MKKTQIQNIPKYIKALVAIDKEVKKYLISKKEVEACLGYSKAKLKAVKEDTEKVLIPHMTSARESLGLSLETVALKVNLSQSYLSQCENGKRPVPIPVLLEYHSMMLKVQKKTKK